jgi:hypothetical protein
MPHFRSMFASDYVGSWEIPKGRDVVLTIARVEAGQLNRPGKRDKEPKPILHFEGKKKGLVMNKTNCLTLEDMFGPDTDDWVGKRIAIYTTTTQFGRQTVDCIRIRDKSPRAGLQRAATAPLVTTDGEVVEEGEPSPLFAKLMTSILDARTQVALDEALLGVDASEQELSQEQIVKLVQCAKAAEKAIGLPPKVEATDAS